MPLFDRSPKCKCNDEGYKVLYVATVVRRHIASFHIPYLKMIKQMGWSTAVAARNDYDDPTDCVIPYCDEYFNIPFERNPLDPRNFRAFLRIKKVIDSGGYDIIHVHTPVGALLGRLAARKSRRTGTAIVYTAHGFHFFSGAPAINWLLYYPVELLLSRLTDVLITINHEDYERAKRFGAKKVMYIPGVGIDTELYAKMPCDRHSKRTGLGLADDDYVIISVGELSKNKNHEVVIEALGILKEQGCINNLHYLICGDGPLASYLQQKVNGLGLNEHVSILGFRKDVPELLKTADIFAFPSIREGLPLSLMEAMASGLPIICSENRGTVDLVENEVSALFANNAESFANAIKELRFDSEYALSLASQAKRDVQRFDLSRCTDQMRRIYLDLVGELPNPKTIHCDVEHDW